jgi:outer membrane biosynthesis protein TonB
VPLRLFRWIALPVLLTTCFARGQQAASTSPSSDAYTAEPGQGLFLVGQNVSAPEILPTDPIVTEAAICKKKLAGKAVLSFLVDASGIPRNIAFEEGAGNGLDQFAYKMISADRFKPAFHQNAPVTVPMRAEVELETCQQKPKGSSTNTPAPSGLSAQPIQRLIAMSLAQEQLEFAPFPNLSKISGGASSKIMGSVSAPVPLNSIEAPFSDEAREESVSGVCLVSLIVDTEGMPRNVRVIRPLGYGLDQKAVDAARNTGSSPQ